MDPQSDLSAGNVQRQLEALRLEVNIFFGGSSYFAYEIHYIQYMFNYTCCSKTWHPFDIVLPLCSKTLPAIYTVGVILAWHYCSNHTLVVNMPSFNRRLLRIQPSDFKSEASAASSRRGRRNERYTTTDNWHVVGRETVRGSQHSTAATRTQNNLEWK